LLEDEKLVVEARCRLVVGVATRGRAPILNEMLAEVARQTRVADRVIVCGSDASDLDGVAQRFPGVITLLSRPGSSRQRNTIIDAAPDADVMIFFDDDFLPDKDYLACVETHMRSHPATMVVTGAVLADGISGPGLSPDEGRRILASQGAAGGATRPTFSGYGCNMVVRLEPLRERGLRFDDRLELYSWQEDVDLSRRLAAFGNVILLEGARGVHLGVKRGRSSGVKLGYSQVANPLYLASKRSGYPMTVALNLIFRNMAKNIVRAFWPEAYVDRRGRLRGNIIALSDLIRGRMKPERVLEV
jgi:GT2 family glycosyltransferase